VPIARRTIVSSVLATVAGLVLAMTVGIGAAGAADSSITHAPNHKITHSTSTNWAGYAVTGGTYTRVTASWTQPAVNCSSTAYSSFWVGLDGDGSNTVEQTGTEADCNGSTPVYSAWYEMYPKYPTNYSNPVVPGDHFTSTVSTDGRGNFTLTLSNTTRGWTQSVSKKLRGAALASAEIIAEAPSSSSGVLPLSNFGTASFTGSTANGQPIGNFSPDRINMASGSTTKATTSSLSGGGNFSATWNHS